MIDLEKAVKTFSYFQVCGIEHLSLETRAGTPLIRLRGPWSPCFQGTAAGELDLVISLNAKGEATLIDGFEAVYH